MQERERIIDLGPMYVIDIWLGHILVWDIWVRIDAS